MNVLESLQGRLREALEGLVPDAGPYAALLKPAQDARFGDYQANCAMPLGKVLGKPPREVAAEVVRRLPLGDVLETPQVAGPGFINLRLRTDWLARQVQAMARDDRLGVAPAAPPRTFVIDFSSPNVAKPLHVGHLRSTIIGDALARLLRFLGHRVITDNHLGDWGTQFGILLYGYKHFLDKEAFERDPVRELARLYVHVRGLFRRPDTEEAEETADPVQEACREETAKLHAGDPENLRLWQTFMPHCYAEIEHIYQRLGVHFDCRLGESFYQPMLADVVRDLLEKGIARPSEGAIVVGEGDPPAIVRKRDGAFTYTTTDLATIRYRIEQWDPDAILYVVGTPQALHFTNLFAAARRWGCTKPALEHVAFGSVFGRDGKLLRAREGAADLLEDLLDQAVAQAARVYEAGRQEQRERGEDVPDVDPEEARRIAEAVGIAAVKYADLSHNRVSDYKFDLEKMTAMDGNTATYMQYAYVRNRGIFRKGDVDPAGLRADPPLPALGTPDERTLALQLVRLGDALADAAAEYRPSQVTSYLWDLSRAYSGFFQNCPVLRAETPELRQGRLLLCDVTARVIQRGLDLLGIRTIERM